MRPLPLKFSVEDGDRAFDEWGANCGPGAIAAILGLTLAELRPHLGDFEAKRYTNPTLMWEILKRLDVDWRLCKPPAWPTYGLVRVQWEGPWTEPGVPMRVRYRHTHWVGCCTAENSIGIFDINAIGNGTGWCALSDWEGILVPWLLKETQPKANGKYHLTHSVEISGLRSLAPHASQAAAA